MFLLKPTNKFKKSLKKFSHFSQKLKDLNTVLGFLKLGKTLPNKYKNHRLQGKQKDFFELHIQPDLLLVYFIEQKTKTIYLQDIGSHSQIFG